MGATLRRRGEGFEPSVGFLLRPLSKRARMPRTVQCSAPPGCDRTTTGASVLLGVRRASSSPIFHARGRSGRCAWNGGRLRARKFDCVCTLAFRSCEGSLDCNVSARLQRQQRAGLRERRTLRAASVAASATRRGRVTQPAPWVAAPGTLPALEAQCVLVRRQISKLKRASSCSLVSTGRSRHRLKRFSGPRSTRVSSASRSGAKCRSPDSSLTSLLQASGSSLKWMARSTHASAVLMSAVL